MNLNFNESLVIPFNGRDITLEYKEIYDDSDDDANGKNAHVNNVTICLCSFEFYNEKYDKFPCRLYCETEKVQDHETEFLKTIIRHDPCFGSETQVVSSQATPAINSFAAVNILYFVVFVVHLYLTLVV